MYAPNLFTHFLAKTRFVVLLWIYVATVLWLGLTNIGFAEETQDEVELDTVVKDFTCKDADGASHTLYALSEEKSATVIVFLATQCPAVTEYVDRITAHLLRLMMTRRFSLSVSIQTNKKQSRKFWNTIRSTVFNSQC